MDTSRFTKPDDEFPLLDFTAKFAFKTTASVSFEIGRIADVHFGDAPDLLSSVFEVVGWIDAHHPCDSSIKAQIRICIPDEYHTFEHMTAMVKSICETLLIPPDEHCELKVFSSVKVTGIIPKVYFGRG